MKNTTTRSQLGGKIRKTKNKTKKIKNKTKKAKNKKMKGGQQVYGRGYGANCYDPNFSIYNTNELQLFPYKPK